MCDTGGKYLRSKGRPRATLARISFSQDAQTGLPARPQAMPKPEAYIRRYVEDFGEPRTKLEACFSVLLVAFEELHRPFMLLGRSPGLEGSEISTLSCLRVLLAGVQPIPAR
jgi:hypothetical protein